MSLNDLPPLPEIVLPAKRTTYPRFVNRQKHTSPIESFSQPKGSKKVTHRTETFLQDAQEVIEGFPSDVLSGRGTLSDIVTKGNRLRGLGIILVLIGAVLFAFEFVQ